MNFEMLALTQAGAPCAQTGGGICIDPRGDWHEHGANVCLTYCSIANNSVTYFHGGVTFAQWQARGAGIAMRGHSPINANATECSITANTAHESGGGIHVDGRNGRTRCRLDSCSVDSNVADSLYSSWEGSGFARPRPQGGGILILIGHVELVSCSLTRNAATSHHKTQGTVSPRPKSDSFDASCWISISK